MRPPPCSARMSDFAIFTKLTDRLFSMAVYTLVIVSGVTLIAK
jgi:hypothetical protein